MSVRLRRLYAEHERLKVLFADHERIRIVEALGDPPDRYVVEYRVKGLVDNKGTIEESYVHQVRITLGPNYPNEMASYVAMTPIFHPNIDHLAVCTADKDAASTKIEDNIVFIGRMITFQDYNLQSPRNGDAAKWTAANLDRLPLERVNLWPSKVLEGAAMPVIRPDQIPTTSQAREPAEQPRCANCGRNDLGANLHQCSNHHLVCHECSVNCANCRQVLCALCPVQSCSECQRQLCADCATRCVKCDRTVCPQHAIECSVCRAIRCQGCSAVCAGCGGLFCGDHLDQGHRCPTCTKSALGALSAQAVRQPSYTSLPSAGQQPAGFSSVAPLAAQPSKPEPPRVEPSPARLPPPQAEPPAQARPLASPICPPEASPVQDLAPGTLPPSDMTSVGPAATTLPHHKPAPPVPPTLVVPASRAAASTVPPAQRMKGAAAPPSPLHFESPPSARLDVAALPAVRATPMAASPKPVEASAFRVSPLPAKLSPTDDGPARSSPRVVITAEEALRVPQSALVVPDARLQIVPSTEPAMSGKAIASLVFGILGLPVVGLLVGWFAIWFGIMAIRQIDQSGRLRGRNMAIVGMTLGIASIVFWVILVAAYGPSLFTSRFANVPSPPVRYY